jgi:hypothetical protein
MTLTNDPIRLAQIFVKAALAKHFSQKIDDESARAAAEKIVSGLPAPSARQTPKRAA